MKTMAKEFYHANNREHLRDICKRERMSKHESREFERVRRLVPFPALLEFAGFPKLRNQLCFAHQGTTGRGTSLSFFEHRDGHPYFCCNKPECGIEGDVVDFWYEVVQRARLQPASWSRQQACADLLARVQSGEIDTRITDFDDASRGPHGRGRGRPDNSDQAFTSRDGYYDKLGQLIVQNKAREIEGSLALPKPVRLSVEQVIRRLFPENRYLMLAKDREAFHPIKMRDVWLSRQYRGPALDCCGFVSQNYCSRCDVDGTSYPAFEGIEHRRWLVIESDRGTLKEQFWIHQQLGPTCLCWSGCRSLHGWYSIEGWSLAQCYDLYAKAISLGVNDRRTWLLCTQARLPGGFNWETQAKQDILVW